MSRRVRTYLRECGHGARLLCSREFWREFWPEFRDYCSPAAIAARLDAFAARVSGDPGDAPEETR